MKKITVNDLSVEEKLRLICSERNFGIRKILEEN